MKILTICQRGNSRSVALSYLFKERWGHHSIAIGAEVTDPQTMTMLLTWCDRVIITDKRLLNEALFPEEHRHKLRVWDVGPDIYFRGYDDGLLEKYQNYYQEALDDGGL